MKVLNIDQLHDAVIHTAEKAYQQKETQDVLNMAAATLQLSQAFQNMKECEIHERFHLADASGGRLLPGEGGPINDRGTN